MEQQNKIDELKETISRIINDAMYCILDEDDSCYLAEELLEQGYRKADEVRAETVRKMQERLEELYTDKLITDDMTVSIGVIKQNIKDIAKEMLEGASD